MSKQTLAIAGGTPTIPEGPPSWPPQDAGICDNLMAAYHSGSWGKYHGPNLDRLCTELTTRFEARFSLPCSSGTIAIELALRALKIGPGDEVLLSGYDFPGNFRAIEAVGARPVLVDIDESTWCMDGELIRDALSDQTKAIVVSHLHGGLAPLPQLCELGHQCGLAIVEDACQCPGALVHGRIAGTWGDIGAVSFGGSKLLTAGRGGALLTNQPELYQRAKVFCERGNNAFPLSELQAAVLIPQLESLAARHAQRLENVQRLLKRTESAPIMKSLRLAMPPSTPAFYKLPWRLDLTRLGATGRDGFIQAVEAEGVELGAGFRGFVKRSRHRCRVASKLTQSQQAADATVLLHHPVLLSDAEMVDRVGDALIKVSQALTDLP